MWQYTGTERPHFAQEPLAGQESVWDYPRPPVLVPSDATVTVGNGEHPVASTTRALRVLETASPPTYYLPGTDVDWHQLTRVAYQSHCEWKGVATYWALANDARGQPVGWSYDNPSDAFANIDGCISFYPARIDCFVNDEKVRPQPGEFYGGWVTDALAGPFKGEPGTGHW